jgi:hypothetical protein
MTESAHPSDKIKQMPLPLRIGSEKVEGVGLKKENEEVTVLGSTCI